MRLKSIIAVGAVLTCSTLLWGCGNGTANNTSQQQNDTVRSESWSDPKRLEASHLEALERMEKDHIHRMVSLSASTDGDKVMTTLERSSQKLEEMHPLAVDRRDELRMGIDPRFDNVPIPGRQPVLNQLAHVVQRYAVTPADAG